MIGSPILRPLVAALVAGACALVPLRAGAQAVIGAPVEQADDGSGRFRRAAVEPAAPAEAPSRLRGRADAAASVSFPTETEVTVAHRWQRREAARMAGDTTRMAEEERELERLRTVLALENLFAVGVALVREADALRAQGVGQRALASCELAVKLAPGLPEAHRCVAWSLLTREPWAVGRLAAAAWGSVRATWEDPRLRAGLLSDELLLLIAGLGAAAMLLVLLLVVRDGRLALHDFHHLFPRGVPFWQTSLVALLLLAFPVLGGLGLMAGLALAGAAVALMVSRAEATAIAVSLGIAAGAPYLAGEVLRYAAPGPAAHDVWLLERGDGSEAAARRLAARVEGGLDHPAALFALGRHHKRAGRLQEAGAWYRRALATGALDGEGLNNLGNVHFLQGDLAEAAKLYRRANQTAPSLAAPLFNLAKVYFREGRLDEGQRAQARALELDGDRVRAFGFQDDLRANLLLMDLPLPAVTLSRLTAVERERLAPGRVGWSVVLGWRSPWATLVLVLLSAAVAAVSPLLVRRLRTSNRCERCGRVACGRCDPELGYSVGMCGQCVSVFVRRTGVDAPVRLRKELAVKAYRRRVRLLVGALSLVLAGAGHLMRGRLAGGVLFLLPVGYLAVRVLAGGSVLLPPTSVDASRSIAATAFGVALLAGVYLLAWRHLWRHDELD